VKENESWRIRENDELEAIIEERILLGLLNVKEYDGMVM
jgi:hypothetical protein